MFFVYMSLIFTFEWHSESIFISLNSLRQSSIDLQIRIPYYSWFMMLLFRLYTLMLIRWGFMIGPIVILPKAEIGRCSCLMMVLQAMSDLDLADSEFLLCLNDEKGFLLTNCKNSSWLISLLNIDAKTFVLWLSYSMKKGICCLSLLCSLLRFVLNSVINLCFYNIHVFSS
ncbi:hypothetical protein Hanom_Chr14g01294251 [Helianthus anomalus]